MSDETQGPKTGEHPATQLEVKTAVTWGAVKMVAAMVVAIFTAGWLGYSTVVHAAESSVDAELVPLKEEVVVIKAQLNRHLDEEAAHHRQQEDQVKEMQADIRALYKAVMTGTRQDRLEKPADGGNQ